VLTASATATHESRARFLSSSVRFAWWKYAVLPKVKLQDQQVYAQQTSTTALLLGGVLLVSGLHVIFPQISIDVEMMRVNCRRWALRDQQRRRVNSVASPRQSLQSLPSC